MRYIENSAILRTVYSGNFRHFLGTFSNIQPCTGILRDFKANCSIFKHCWSILCQIQTYSEVRVILTYTTKPPLHKPPLPWRIPGCVLAFRHYIFHKMLNLKCLAVFWICLCLDNCSVICTATLCNVLHQTHSESWYI